jgi:hypothetical protein
MKWTLILKLSLIEIALAVASIFFISPNAETILWLASVLFYAYAIGNGTRQYRFFHGMVLGILNGIWVSTTRSIFLARYLAGHPIAVTTIDMISHSRPRLSLTATAIVTGIGQGIVIGVFAVVAGFMVKPRRIDLAAEPEMLEPGTEA